ncbi:MAG: bifunctional adenosylcobinamide kinase/adenosylcobinamide-phosphate guanylyltransferase [Anaerolineae bacterium]|nr:bifunctional adenosylcobinamide kinase/adenosylcobinamide-phosphate guanylyltransferase [Anaerolineae bacterium]
MGKLIVILGGARSGKSNYAEQIVRERGGDHVLYVATAGAEDDEMRERIRKHRQSRPAAWRTLEAPENVGTAVLEAAGDAKAVLVDCLTVLVANRLLAVAGPEDKPFDAPSDDPFQPAIEADVQSEVESIVDCARQLAAEVVVVSNEVGMGLVPPYDLGRAYRDLLGRANQIAAGNADEVYLLVAGIPMRIK